MNNSITKILSVTLAAVLVGLALSCAAPPTTTTANISVQTKKRVVEVRRGTLSENVTVEGNLEMPRYRNLRFGLSDGEVKEVLVKEGDMVKAGQLLAKLDDAKQRLDIKVANNTLQRKLSDLYETVPRLPQFQTIYNITGFKGYDYRKDEWMPYDTPVGTNPYINYPNFYANYAAIYAFKWAEMEIESAHRLAESENWTSSASELTIAASDLEGARMILDDAINNPDSGLGNMAPFVPADPTELVSLELLLEQPPSVTLIVELRKALAAVKQLRVDIINLIGLINARKIEEAKSSFDAVMPIPGQIAPVLYNNVAFIKTHMDDDVYGRDLALRLYGVAEQRLNDAFSSDIASQRMMENLQMAAHYLQLCNGILGTNDYVLKHGLTMQNEQNYTVAVASARVGLDSAKNNFLNTYLWAPIDGMIVSVNVYPKKVLSQELAVDAIVLVDTAYLEFWGAVDEIDSAKILPGQRAVISVDAVPDREFYGTVNFLSSLGASSTGTTTTSTGGVVKFNVTVELDPTDIGLKGKLTATANIPVSMTENALLLPLAAVVNTDGKPAVTVEVDSSGKTEKRVVKTGRKNLQYIQIVEGLKEGDRVVIEDKAVNVTVSTRPPAPPGGGPSR